MTSCPLFLPCVCVFQDQPTVAAHCFKEGMKLEAVDPTAPVSIRPATVTKVTDLSIIFWLSGAVPLCHYGLGHFSSFIL